MIYLVWKWVISSLFSYDATCPRSSVYHNFPRNNVLISQWTYSLFATQTKKHFRPFTSRKVTCNKEPRCGSSRNYSTSRLQYLSPRITIPLKILHTSTATVSQIIQQKQACMNHRNAILGGDMLPIWISTPLKVPSSYSLKTMPSAGDVHITITNKSNM